MTDTKFLKASAWRSIDSRKDWLIDIAKQILVNPEPGFFEKKTATYVSYKINELEKAHDYAIA